MPARSGTILKGLGKACIALGMLYFFLLSIELLSSGFKLMGKNFGEQLIRTTENPLLGLVIGILVTSIIQSSSCTTSIVVALVGGGSLSIENAVPIIMGANIGTTITNTLVSLGHITRRDEFRRAMASASVHDLFNVCCVIVFLPLEIATGFLRHAASWLSEHFAEIGGLTFVSPLKTATEPLALFVSDTFKDILPFPWAAIAMVVLALVVLFAALTGLVKVMRSAALSRFEVLFDKFVGRYPVAALLLGLVVTAIIQSSSITTSLLVTMAGAGIITVEQVYPVTLGANVGTTVTALLAALATGRVEGLTIAFVHLLFNICGLFLFFVIPGMKRIPIRLAKFMANVYARARYYAILYVMLIFFGVPGLIILLQKLIGGK